MNLTEKIDYILFIQHYMHSICFDWTTAHIVRGHIVRGHIVRGHIVRGHIMRGHIVRGHIVHGHIMRGHIVRGHMTAWRFVTWPHLAFLEEVEERLGLIIQCGPQLFSQLNWGCRIASNSASQVSLHQDDLTNYNQKINKYI